jgi:hypothetical protein
MGNLLKYKKKSTRNNVKPSSKREDDIFISFGFVSPELRNNIFNGFPR